MYIKCASSEEIKKAIPETCSFIESMGSDSGCMIISSREVSSSLVQKYIYFKGTKIYESLVKPIVLDAAIKAETHAASSGDLCLALISLMTKRRIKISNLLKIASSIEDQKISKRTNRKDVIRAIEALFSDSFQRKFLKEVLDNSNSLTPIFLERTNLKNSQIRVSSGYNFKISVDQEYLNEGAWSFKNVNCYVIDGHIESVGEIHHLLEKASDSREPYIVFARDASKDVISTIQYNFKRGTMNLILVSVGFDENTLNILNDISVCTGADLISSYKGDLISKSTQKDPVSLKKVTISKSDINIVSTPEKNNISSHLRYLNKKKLESIDSPDLNVLFDKRIKSLSEGKVEMLIGTDMIFKDPQIIEKIDKFLRELRSLISTGVIYGSDIREQIPGISSFIKNEYPYSTASLLYAIKNSVSAINSIESIEMGIYKE